jgi:hypothetical protein
MHLEPLICEVNVATSYKAFTRNVTMHQFTSRDCHNYCIHSVGYFCSTYILYKDMYILSNVFCLMLLGMHVQEPNVWCDERG